MSFESKISSFPLYTYTCVSQADDETGIESTGISHYQESTHIAIASRCSQDRTSHVNVSLTLIHDQPFWPSQYPEVFCITTAIRGSVYRAQADHAIVTTDDHQSR